MLTLTPQDVEELKGTMALILRKVSELQPHRLPLSRNQFARETGMSVRTVYKKIRDGEIRVVAGRIPASECDKYLT